MAAIWLRLRQWLWEREGEGRRERALILAGRTLAVLVRDLADGQLSMRAMSLVYTTLLSLVPLLALGFSLFKALGIHNMLEPALLKFFAPLGPRGAEVTASIISFVDNIRVGVLGTFGVGLLFYTAISMIQKVETSFNFIWRIERSRPLAQRFGEYLSVLLVGPVLMFSAIGVTAAVFSSTVVLRLQQIEPFGFLIYSLGRALPYALIIVAFSFLYAFVPNTKVRLRAALAGGVVAGVLWESGSLAFARFVATASNYNAVYSGFAIVIFVMLWLYLGWLILLVGCQLAFYVQSPTHLSPHPRAPHLAGRQAELLGLAILAETGQRFLRGEPGLTEAELAGRLGAEPEHVNLVVDVLLHHGLLSETGNERVLLQPGRDLSALTVAEAWALMRQGADPAPRAAGAGLRAAAELLQAGEAAFVARYGTLSLREWLQRRSGGESGA